MSLLPRPLRGTLSFAHASPKLARLISQRSPGRKPIKIANQPEESGHFQNVGIRPQLVDALKTAFPNVQAPTSVQARLLNAINDRKDVTIKDATGTGKTFGIMLALMNKPRISKSDRKRVNEGAKVPINSLLIVPHKDLAFQVQHWIQRIVSAMPPSPLNTYSSVAGVLVRGTGEPLEEQAKRLKEDPPHVLIGTPQAIWEMMSSDKEALQLKHIDTVVVDEVDYLLPSVPRGMSRYQREKLEKRMSRHPSVTAKIIDEIVQAHPQKEDRVVDGKHWRDLSVKERQDTKPPLQLVFASATLRTHLDNELRHRDGWLTKGGSALAQIVGKSRYQAVASPSVGNAVIGGSGITHSVLLVNSDGDVSNVKDAVERPAEQVPATDEDTQEGIVASTDAIDVANELDLDDPVSVGGVRKSITVDATVLECIAACFALDVPRVAMLVVPATAPVHAFVGDLRDMGVNAHGLDLLADDRGRNHLLRGPSDEPVANPTLLVTTEASTRGIDLPELSHIFLLGIPEGRKGDSYLHMAGRVGRFGRGGQVITVLPKGDVKSSSNPARKMVILLRELGIVPTKFEHFN